MPPAYQAITPLPTAGCTVAEGLDGSLQVLLNLQRARFGLALDMCHGEALFSPFLDRFRVYSGFRRRQLGTRAGEDNQAGPVPAARQRGL